MSRTLFSGIVNDSGHGAPVTDLVRSQQLLYAKRGQPSTLHLSAFCSRSYDAPKSPVHLLLETSADGKTWATLIDLGEVRDDCVVTAEALWDGVSEVRVRYEFDPGEATSYWWPRVRLD